jgi:hypothetical protein
MPEWLVEILAYFVGIPVMFFVLGVVGTVLFKSGDIIWRTCTGMVMCQVLAVILMLYGAASVLAGVLDSVPWFQRVALSLGGLSMIACGGLAFYFAHRRWEKLHAPHEAKRSALSNLRNLERQVASLYKFEGGLDPGIEASIRLRLARAYLCPQVMDLEKAWRALGDTIRIGATNADVYLEAGCVQRLLGNHEAAEALWTEYRKHTGDSASTDITSRLLELKEGGLGQ